MSIQAPEHVVIVGCGFTGTTALHQLVTRYPVRRITVFESDATFGPGFPYQESETREYLINNTNDTMCLDPSNRRAFVEWLQAHPKHSVGLDEKGHMPRAIYGEFLRDAIANALQIAAEKGIEVEMIGEECTDIEEADDGETRARSATVSVKADMVILATGRCPDYDAFGLGDANEGHYFATHMPGTKLDVIPIDATVHIMGASLSAYDVINQLYSPEAGCRFVDAGDNRLRFDAGDNRRSVVLCSRSGRLKKAQSRFPRAVKREHFNKDAIGALPHRASTVEEVFEWMLKDAALNQYGPDLDTLLNPYSDCNNTEDVTNAAASILAADIDAAASNSGDNFTVDYLENAQFDIWDLFAANKLSEAEEQRYRSRFESGLLTCSAPCPIPTAQKILALIEAGRLTVMKGVRSIKPSGDGFEIEHAFGSDSASYIVNATGTVDRMITSDAQPALLRNLSNRDLIRPYQLNGADSPGIAVDMSTFRCNGSRNIFAASMLLWGPGFFTSSAIMMATVIKRLLDAAYDQ